MKLRNVEFDTMTAEGIVGYVGSVGVALLLGIASFVVIVAILFCVLVMTGVLCFIGFVMALLHISGVDIRTWLDSLEYGKS